MILAGLRVSLPVRLLRRQPETLHLHPLHRHQAPQKIRGDIPETHLQPLLDRIDIHKVPCVLQGIEVPRVDYEKLSSDRLGESSAVIRERVQAARQRQRKRFEGERAASRHDAPLQIVCNADMRVAEIRKFCKLDETGDSLIRAAMSQMNLSARAYHRILKLARTIADLAGSENIQPPHLAEALQYRPKLLISG